MQRIALEHLELQELLPLEWDLPHSIKTHKTPYHVVYVQTCIFMSHLDLCFSNDIFIPMVVHDNNMWYVDFLILILMLIYSRQALVYYIYKR